MTAHKAPTKILVSTEYLSLTSGNSSQRVDKSAKNAGPAVVVLHNIGGSRVKRPGKPVEEPPKKRRRPHDLPRLKPVSKKRMRNSKQEAAGRGHARYFTGKPCKRGHVAERYASTGACVECVSGTRPVAETVQHPVPATRAEARALCVPRYFTGSPCKHGHAAERYTSTASCVECDKLNRLKRVRKSNEFLEKGLRALKAGRNDL